VSEPTHLSKGPWSVSRGSHRGISGGNSSGSQGTHDVKLEKLRFYRAEIQHEFNLLSNRVNAYITSQSFLVVGFALAMGNLNPRWGSLFRLIFPAALALLGIATSKPAWPGIRGACDSIALWREKQQRLFEHDPGHDPGMDDYRIERPIVHSSRGRSVDLIHERSLWFAKCSPWIFTIGWLVFGGLAFALSLKEWALAEPGGAVAPAMWAGQLSSFDRRRTVLGRGACAGGQ
jgi:hypothetical protein